MKAIKILFYILISVNLSSCGLVVSALIEVIKSSGEETETSESNDPDYSTSSLDDDFDKNNHLWKEVNTTDEKLIIENGVYSISSINSKSSYTIGSPVNLNFLSNIPDKYLISSKIIEQTQLGKNEVNSGLILNSSDIEYIFLFSPKGLISVSKFNLISKEHLTVFNNTNDSIGMKDSIEFSIYFYEKYFDLNVNGNLVGHGELESRNWSTIGLVTSKQSTAKFDYLKLFEM